MLCGCHDDNYTIIDGNGNGAGDVNVTLALSPISFTDAAADGSDNTTRTLSYDFVYGDKTKAASITARWDTVNSVGVFPIAPESNSQVRYTFKSERVAANTAKYQGEGWNLKSDNTYASYYPYQDFLNTKSSKEIPMSFHDQLQIGNYNLNHLDSINNIYYATAHRPEGNNDITFSYKRAAGILWVRIVAPDMDLDYGTLTIASYDGKKIFTDSATVDVATGEIKRIKTSDRTVLHFKHLKESPDPVETVSKGDTLNLFLTMAPIGKTAEESRVDKLVFELRSFTTTYYSVWIDGAIPLANEGKWFTIHPSSAKRAYVDMGLDSGIQWAECNLGAVVPTDPGLYYAWGETYPSLRYFWHYYDFIPDVYEKNGDCTTGAQLTKYTIPDEQYYGCWYDNTHQFIGDGKRVLDKEDNAAVQRMGEDANGHWDIPTKEQYDELITNSTMKWIEDYKNSGMNGYLCTSNKNGNTIFFPAAGYMGKENERDDDSDQVIEFDNDLILNQRNARGEGFNGYYWTKTLSPSYSTDAYEFKFNTYMVNNGVDDPYRATPVPNISTSKRYLGQSIRPVYIKGVK